MEVKIYINESGTADDMTKQYPMTAIQRATSPKGKQKWDDRILMKETWTNEPMYGTFHSHLGNKCIDIKHSFQWMKYRGLKCETEGFIMTVQDQVLNTRCYCKHIIKQGTTDKCRKCHSHWLIL